ncbi:hypothetical protein F4777DRAFT_589137 [Nemania sp. FL0916]|nr:hypothetical protein F4777DRAFT_589137 [Nemania sp. FL0916]
MSIPSNRRTAEDDVPPPLPPPRFLPTMMPPGPLNHDRFPSIDSNASGDGARRDSESDPARFRKQDVGRLHQRDEGYHSMHSTLSSISSQDSLPKNLFMSHNQFQFNRSAGSDYDSHLLKKLDSRRVFDNRSPPRRSGLAMSLDQNKPDSRRSSNAPQLSLPVRLHNPSSIDSPSRFGESSAQPRISPNATPYFQGGGLEYRSPVESVDVDRSPLYRARRNNSDDATMSIHSINENMDDTDFPMEETSGIRKLHIDDSHGRPDYQAVGLKRRASSPPGGNSPPLGPLAANDPTRRRDGVGRGSPAPRLSLVPPSSLSSVSTAGRSGSYVSTASLNTSISSLNSFGGRSPSGLSSGGLSPVDIMANSPYSTAIPLGHPSCSSARGPHQRSMGNDNRQLVSPRKVVEVPKATISKLQGNFFMCECCPKKPKKFETHEELSAHEAEKQYECSFCGNRFKNKNEAERHQNSLHVRRHSWSCSALLMSGLDRAFHESTIRPGEADTCGYCGEEFGRTGGAARPRQATERDWDQRLKHLQEVHKFRECNSSKKFYRADHFRQHLKHSHAGTSGKWTNMLENACMLDEEPPQPPR